MSLIHTKEKFDCPGCGEKMMLDENNSGELFDAADEEWGGDCVEAIILKCPACRTNVDLPEKIARKKGLID